MKKRPRTALLWKTVVLLVFCTYSSDGLCQASWGISDSLLLKQLHQYVAKNNVREVSLSYIDGPKGDRFCKEDRVYDESARPLMVLFRAEKIIDGSVHKDSILEINKSTFEYDELGHLAFRTDTAVLFLERRTEYNFIKQQYFYTENQLYKTLVERRNGSIRKKDNYEMNACVSGVITYKYDQQLLEEQTQWSTCRAAALGQERKPAPPLRDNTGGGYNSSNRKVYVYDGARFLGETLYLTQESFPQENRHLGSNNIEKEQYQLVNVYDENGRLSALKYILNSAIYTAFFTYDEDNNVSKIVKRDPLGELALERIITYDTDGAIRTVEHKFPHDTRTMTFSYQYFE